MLRRNVLAWVVCVIGMTLIVSCAGPTATPVSPTAPAVAPAVSSTAASNSTATSSGSGQTVDVAARDFEFSPKELTVKQGTTVKWTNQGQAKHTITADDGKSFDGTVTAGQTFTFTFDKPGTYAYHCTLHGGAGGQGMSGTIIVQ